MSGFETVSLFIALLTGVGSFIAWLINGEMAKQALKEAKRATEISIQANIIAENANSLSREALKLPFKQYQILIQPVLTARLLNPKVTEDGFFEITIEFKNKGQGPAIEVKFHTEGLGLNLFSKLTQRIKVGGDWVDALCQYYWDKLYPNVTCLLQFTTDPKSKRETTNGVAIRIDIPDGMEDFYNNYHSNRIFATYKNEDGSQRFIQMIHLSKFRDEEWKIEIDDPTIRPEVIQKY